MTNAAKRRELTAMLIDRDLVGLTEVNPEWYLWIKREFLPESFPNFESAFDGYDCVLLWDTRRFVAVGDATVIRFFAENELSDLPDSYRSCWRQIMAMEFTDLAPPQVSFHAAVTHSHRSFRADSKA